MTWGKGKWGAGAPWGTGLAAPPPILHGVSPALVERRGGDVIMLLGENFSDPMTVEIMRGGLVIASCSIFDPVYDVKRNRTWAGSPALEAGFYDLRVTTVGGESNVLPNALEFRLFSEEMKIQRVKIGYASKWATDRRMLNSNTLLEE